MEGNKEGEGAFTCTLLELCKNHAWGYIPDDKWLLKQRKRSISTLPASCIFALVGMF